MNSQGFLAKGPLRLLRERRARASQKGTPCCSGVRHYDPGDPELAASLAREVDIVVAEAWFTRCQVPDGTFRMLVVLATMYAYGPTTLGELQQRCPACSETELRLALRELHAHGYTTKVNGALAPTYGLDRFPRGRQFVKSISDIRLALTGKALRH